MLTIIERARRYIAKCPWAISGQNGHNETFRIAKVLVDGFALSKNEALPIIREWNASCVPPWTDSDLVHKINSAANAPPRRPRGWLLGDSAGLGKVSSVNLSSPPLPQKAEFQPDELKRIAQNVCEIKEVVRFISERSLVRVETQDSASVLRRLYTRGSGEKVLIFTDMKSQGQFVWEADKSDVTQNFQLPTGHDGVWFLPQPVSGKYQPNDNGKMSRRSQEAVTAWRYAVLESDQAAEDDWLRCLVQMPLPIACICGSGGRSIHALVRVDATSKSDWDQGISEVKLTLITLGADRSALSAVRLSRLPQAKRGERVQRLLYLNPEPTGMPILRQPTQEVLSGRKWTLEEVPRE